MTDIPVTVKLSAHERVALQIANLEEALKDAQFEYRTTAWDLRELKDAFLRHVHEKKEADRDG